MPINKTIKTLFLAIAIFFQFYLVYASTLYLTWRSTSFLVVVLTAVASVIAITSYVCVVCERNKI